MSDPKLAEMAREWMLGGGEPGEVYSLDRSIASLTALLERVRQEERESTVGVIRIAQVEVEASNERAEKAEARIVELEESGAALHDRLKTAEADHETVTETLKMKIRHCDELRAERDRLREALNRVLTEAGLQAHKHGCPNRLMRPAKWDEFAPCAGCEAERTLASGGEPEGGMMTLDEARQRLERHADWMRRTDGIDPDNWTAFSIDMVLSALEQAQAEIERRRAGTLPDVVPEDYDLVKRERDEALARVRELEEMGRVWASSDEHKNAVALRDALEAAETRAAKLRESLKSCSADVEAALSGVAWREGVLLSIGETVRRALASGESQKEER